MGVPRSVRGACVTAVLALAASAPTPSSGQSAFTLDDVSFLTGCWGDTSAAVHVLEQWTEASGGLMLSTTRFVRDGRVVDWEFGRIVEEASGLTLWPYPRGTISEHGFPLVSVDGEHVFENPEHDFPVRIVYRRITPEKLQVRVEGDSGQVIAWEFQRRSCPG